MGWAVIIFTIVFRIVILPLSINAGRSEKEKYEIHLKVEEINKNFSHDQTKYKQMRRQLVKANPFTIISELTDIFIQVMIALMLYRMFTSGLEGADFHYLYKFIHTPKEAFNLTWMSTFDLTKPNILLNLINSITIFLAEFVSMRFSAFPIGRNEKLTLLILPLGAYIFFSQMPAGKKLFVITTLLFSIVLMLIRRVSFHLTKGSPTMQGWTNTFKKQISNKA